MSPPWAVTHTEHRPSVTDQPDKTASTIIKGSGASSTAAYRRWLACIVLAGLAARVAIVIYAERNPAAFDFPDSHRYVRVAENIAAGHGPIDHRGVLPGSDRNRPALVRSGTDPAYPALLAIGRMLGFEAAEPDAPAGGLMRFGRIANALLGSASILLLWWLGRRLLGDDRAALIGAAVLAVDPITLYFTALVLTETSYLFLMLAALCAIATLDGRRPLARASIAGVCLGLGALARSSGLLLPIVLLPFVWRGPDAVRSRRALVTGVYLFAFALVLTPTVARNHRLFGRFVPVRTGSGASLLEAWGPWADGGPGMDRIVYPAMPAGADEYELDQIARKAALDWAMSHPGDVLSLAWKKFARTWSITVNAAGYGGWHYAAIGWLTVAPVYVLAALGVWFLRRRWRIVALLLAPAAYFTLLHVIWVGSVRYRVPAMPGFFLLAAASACRLWVRRAPGRTGDTVPG